MTDDDDNLTKDMQFIKTEAHDLREHMDYQNTRLVNVIYQNRSTWPVGMHDWSKQKYLIYQNRNT